MTFASIESVASDFASSLCDRPLNIGEHLGIDMKTSEMADAIEAKDSKGTIRTAPLFLLFLG